MAVKAGQWNADNDTQCVDVNRTSDTTARITVRSNAEHMTDREAKLRTMAYRCAPDDGLGAVATIYTQFASQGFTYATYVVAWA